MVINGNFVAIAVVGAYDNQLEHFYDVVLLTSEYKSSKYSGVREDALLKLLSSSKKLRMLNFDVQGGRVIDSCGKFSRLQDKNGVSPKIVVADIVTSSGRTTGYMVLDKTGGVYRYSKEDMLSLCSQAKARGISFIQNGIFRPNDEQACIASYPNKPFIRIVLNKATKKKAKAEVSKTYVDKKRNQENLKEPSSKYTLAQMKELTLAKENGVDPLLIGNPKLTPQQMHILWVAKRNGVASEYFAHPKFSVDAMRFFADRIVNKKVFMECRQIMKPEYDVQQLTELYLGVYSGIDYMSYADPSLGSEQMYIKRLELESKMWHKPQPNEFIDANIPETDIDTCVSSFLSRRVGNQGDK